MKKLFIPYLFVILFTGCKASKDIIYLQDAGSPALYSSTQISPIPEPVIKVGDLLSITINSTSTPEAAQPFNLPIVPISKGENAYNIGSGTGVSGGAGGLQNYLVDTEGKIVFPVLGKLLVTGMTKMQLSDLIKGRIFPRYLKEEPIILIRFAGFKISVLGEVGSPGVFNIDNEKVSILEALAEARDLTMFGRRDNILLIREKDGKRETIRIDIRNKNLINSPYYYLQQNDVLYVQPNDKKIRNTEYSATASIPLSLLGTALSLTSLVFILISK